MTMDCEGRSTPSDVEFLLKVDDGRAAYLINKDRFDLSNEFPAVVICYPLTLEYSYLVGKKVVAFLEDGAVVIRKLGNHRDDGKCDLFSYHRPSILEANLVGIRRIIGQLVQMEDPISTAKEALSQPWIKLSFEEGSMAEPMAH